MRQAGAENNDVPARAVRDRRRTSRSPPRERHATRRRRPRDVEADARAAMLRVRSVGERGARRAAVPGPARSTSALARIAGSIRPRGPLGRRHGSRDAVTPPSRVLRPNAPDAFGHAAFAEWTIAARAIGRLMTAPTLRSRSLLRPRLASRRSRITSRIREDPALSDAHGDAAWRLTAGVMPTTAARRFHGRSAFSAAPARHPAAQVGGGASENGIAVVTPRPASTASS